MKLMLEAPGTKRWKLKHDQPPSKFAFKSNLRRYMKEARRCDARDAILTQWKQTMSGPEWEASDYEWWGLAYMTKCLKVYSFGPLLKRFNSRFLSHINSTA
jgi:hypothetical protein